jgi:hypothetical protein
MPRAKNPLKEQERRRKISEALKGKIPKNLEMLHKLKPMKGRIPWNKGKQMFSLRGDRNPAKRPEVRKKISERKKGWIPPIEWRIKISKSKMGKPSPRRGIKLSEETKRKISEHRKGKTKMEKHPNWKGGITPEIIKIRNSVEIKQWRKAVFERDNFTCQICEQHGGDLVAHHINNFADFPELRFAIDNGITLCKKCHTMFHTIYGFKNNTKEQLEEFRVKFKKQ